MGGIQKGIRRTYSERAALFLKRQIGQIQTGGWPVFGRKLVFLIKVIAAVPVVALIRLLRPIIVIRIGRLWSEQIGHFAGNTEVYLCERDAGINVPSRPFVDVFYHMPLICNSQLKKMWDRTLNVVPFNAYPIERLNHLLPGGETHGNLMPNFDRDIHGLMDGIPPHISFTPEEERRGENELKDLGIPEGSPFVCFHARDSAYHNKTFENFDAGYHNYRDSIIHNYVPAAEKLARRGYFSVRMGAVVSEALMTANERIIDYATNGRRNDFMDIYLGAKCFFFISSGTGIDAIPTIFRRPIVFVNLVPLEYGRFWSGNLIIPKKHWLRSESRFMTFREILETGAGRFLRKDQYDEKDIELIENTPEEISAVVIEMVERIRGTWTETEEDKELQGRFWSLIRPSDINGVFRARIGAEFLRQHRGWLD